MDSTEKASLPFIVKIQVILAVLATIVTIGLAAYIPTLVQKKKDLDAEIAQRQQEIADLKKQKEDADKKLAEADKLANAVSSALYAASPTQLQKTIDDSLNSSPDAGLKPRIFVHIRAASQRPAARQVADSLRQKGYVVPGIQILVAAGPDETQVRYFHAADESGAEAILSQLVAAGVKNVAPKPNYVAGHDDIRQRQYEIWFAPDSL